MGEKPKVVIHTDGACSGNPGPGGWGAILQSGQHRKELKGGEAAHHQQSHGADGGDLGARGAEDPSDVDLYTDSNYLRGGITSWIKGWKRNGWRTADKKAVRNIELWQRLEQAAEPHHVRWHWVKGHHGHDENERADELAREGMAADSSAHRKRAGPASDSPMSGTRQASPARAELTCRHPRIASGQQAKPWWPGQARP